MQLYHNTTSINRQLHHHSTTINYHLSIITSSHLLKIMLSQFIIFTLKHDPLDLSILNKLKKKSW